jgi:predicted aspartyl protease
MAWSLAAMTRRSSFSRGRLWLYLASAALAGIASPATATPGGTEARVVEMQRLLESHDYFSLRERLDAARVALDPQTRYFQAFVEQAFNRPARSNELIAVVLAERTALPERNAFQLRQAEINNHLRLFQYGLAARKAAAVVASPPSSATARELTDLGDIARLCRPLEDVPAQRIERRGATSLKLAHGEIPVSVRGQTLGLGLDTGANLSIIIRSEAERLGLKIRPAGIEVDTVTGAKQKADLAVADRLTIGNVVVDNVVFLVFPDELLSFPDGSRVAGLLGFPVIDALGEVVRRRDGTIEIPLEPTQPGPQNLALTELDLLTVVRYRRDSLVCRLDTGASTTVLFEPFFRRYQGEVTRLARAEVLPFTGVGGRRTFKGYRLPHLGLTVAGHKSTLSNIDVFSATLKPSDAHLSCNLGRDVLQQASAYRLNLRSMSLTFEE